VTPAFVTTHLHSVTLLLQAGLVVTAVEGARRRDVAAAVNGLVSLCAALLPAAVAAAGSVDFGPILPLWVAFAGLLHSVGMLGPYDSTWWWDHVTHTVSAALVAALVYAGVVTVARAGGVGLGPGAAGAVTVALVFAVGVFWELVELAARRAGERFGVEPVLVHYGPRDTAFDLVFDLVGALAVVTADFRAFVPVADRFPGATRVLLLGVGATAVVGSALLALWTGVGRDG
jgi:hypothetical protein